MQGINLQGDYLDIFDIDKIGPEMASGRVRRRRTKVSRACYNCRRRKIKCTGKHPCTNCEAYQCECLYFPGYVPVKKEDLKSNIQQPIIPRQGNKNLMATDNNGRNFEEVTNFHQIEEDDLIQDYDSNELLSIPPFELNNGKSGFYEDDIEIQKKLLSLQQCLKQLKSIHRPNEHICQIINSINGEVDMLVNSWEPTFDFKKCDEILKNGGGNIKSLETHLMKNKYTDQVALTNLAVWTDTNKAEDEVLSSSFLANQALVDTTFGLYSPVQALSLRGIGYMFHRCLKAATSTERKIQVKSNLYLLLRFFDICIDHYNRSCVSIANPLESYLQRKDPLVLSPNATSSVSSRSNGSSKDLIGILINRLPVPFVQCVTSVDSKQLLNTMHDDFKMFHLLLKMLDRHKEGFESLMIKITANPGNLAMGSGKLSSTDVQDFIGYCEEEELLMALSYSYYNSTLYHFDEFSRSLEYFELLLSLLDKQIWLQERYGFEKVLDVATSYAMKLGLARWEFYVGLDEVTAESRRQNWWKYYCIEKENSFLTGFLSSLNDSTMNCLLPKMFRDVGFSDHRDFISKVHLVFDNSVFNAMSLKDLAFYGECGICQLLSDFYGKTLYAERYTAMKNAAKPPFVRYHFLEDVWEDVEMLKKNLDAIKSQTRRLYDIAYSRNEYKGEDARVSRKDKMLAVHYVLLQGCLLFYVLSAVNNLVTRLQLFPQHYFKSKETKYREILHDEYITMTRLLLSLEDDYSVSRAFQHYGNVFLMIALGSFYGHCFKLPIAEIVMILKLVKRLKDISVYRANGENFAVKMSKTYNDYSRLCTLASILSNGLLQNFMFLNDITKEHLFRILAETSPDLGDLPSLILDPKSEVYRNLMQPIQQSGVHINIKKMLERGQECQKGAYPKTAVQSLSPKSNKDSPSIEPFSFGHDDIPMQGRIPDVIRSKRKVTSPTAIPIDAFLNNDASSANVTHGPTRENSSPLDLGFQPMIGTVDGTKINLGTIDEFVQRSDLNDLYSTIWSDLYSDELGQSFLSSNAFAPEFGGQN